MPAASEAASRSVMLDPLSAEAHTALAYVSLLWDRDFPKAERHFLEALKLNPQVPSRVDAGMGCSTCTGGSCAATRGSQS